MKVVWVANARLPTERAHGIHIVRMCEAFSQQGVETVLLHPRRRQKNPLLKSQSIFEYYKVQVPFEVKTLSNWDVIRLRRSLPRELFTWFYSAHAFLFGLFAGLASRREGADLFYTRDIPVAWWLSRMGLPTVLEVHGIPRRALAVLVRTCMKSPSLRLVVTLNEHMKKGLMRFGLKDEKIKVLHSGVDLGGFDIPLTKDQARSKIGFDNDKVLAVYAGQLFPEKGVDTLVKAACLLDRVEVLVVGGGASDISRLEGLKRQIGASNVTLKGHLQPEEVPFYLRASDCLVLPNSKDHVMSAYHTSPMKLFEYMTSGSAVVASDLPAVREVLRHGVNGWLVESDDPHALAEGIKHLLADTDLATKLAAKAYEDVQGYSWEIRSKEIIRLACPGAGS